jgi:hypothetical protein
MEGGDPINAKEENTRSQIDRKGGGRGGASEKNEEATANIVMVAQPRLRHLRKTFQEKEPFKRKNP